MTKNSIVICSASLPANRVTMTATLQELIKNMTVHLMILQMTPLIVNLDHQQTSKNLISKTNTQPMVMIFMALNSQLLIHQIFNNNHIEKMIITVVMARCNSLKILKILHQLTSKRIKGMVNNKTTLLMNKLPMKFPAVIMATKEVTAQIHMKTKFMWILVRCKLK